MVKTPVRNAEATIQTTRFMKAAFAEQRRRAGFKQKSSHGR
jgi:hypothetical protein